MADIVSEVVGEVVASQGAQRCCQSKVDESNWQLSKVVDAQRPVTPGVTAKYDLAPGQCAPSTIAALWVVSVLAIVAGVIVPAAIDGKWGNNLQSLWALGSTFALLGWAASRSSGPPLLLWPGLLWPGPSWVIDRRVVTQVGPVT